MITLKIIIKKRRGKREREKNHKMGFQHQNLMKADSIKNGKKKERKERERERDRGERKKEKKRDTKIGLRAFDTGALRT